MSELVSDIMERDVITLDVSNPLLEVFNVFDQIKIRHIPIVTGETLVGMISYSDVAVHRKGYDPDADEQDEEITSLLKNTVVKDYMNANPISVRHNQTIIEVAEIFAKSAFHAMPVTDDHKLVGIISTTDLIRYFVEKFK